MDSSSSFNRIAECRHGRMVFNVNDQWVGRSLELYGEWSQLELDLLGRFLSPGQVVVDVGANYGSHTLDFAQRVGPSGKVLAFEPQRIVFQALTASVALNSLTQVHTHLAAVGARHGKVSMPAVDYAQTANFGGVQVSGEEGGEPVELVRIDDLSLAECHLLKADVEGMEEEVLRGAVATLQRAHPVLYLECDRQDRVESLLAMVEDLGYRGYWHLAPAYNPGNFRGNPNNVFGRTLAINLLCLPASSEARASSAADHDWVEREAIEIRGEADLIRVVGRDPATSAGLCKARRGHSRFFSLLAPSSA